MYSGEVTCISGLVPRSANDSRGMQVMSKEDKAAYDRCIMMYQQSACAPLIFFDSILNKSQTDRESVDG